MIGRARRMAAVVAVAAAVAAHSIAPARAQSCPAPLANARRLVLVTAETMNETAATMRLYERTTMAADWHAVGAAEPALLGKGGMGWSAFFMQLARRGEPIKVEGDKRAPAGIYKIGRSFGIVPSSRRNHLQITPDTICVHDPSSPAYNTIASRARLGPTISAENMSRALPMYRRGLLVDYPTDRKKQAGSCIFIHVWRSPTTGTAGCVSLPEPRVEALQDFSADGAVLAILPRGALDRLRACLPPNQLSVGFLSALSSENAGISMSKPSPPSVTIP
jgi:L,D-peptidoglycan transpeptidase YkuD (ErfK/YbiS/YcfS/YnhG family)